MNSKNENSFLERTFKLSEHNTNVRTEVLAGLTTFMTMAYILAVNPDILSAAGMDWYGVFTATAIASFIGTMIMALHANYPFGLAPGMGLNAFFAFSVVLGMGKSWQFALTAVFLEGILFVILSLFNVREQIFDAIPANLKKGVSIGIGLFIALIGMLNSGIVTSGKVIYPDGVPTLLEGGLVIDLGNIREPSAVLTIIGIIIIGVLLARKVKGAIFFGIILTTLIGIPMGVTQLPDHGLFEFKATLAPVAFQLEFGEIFSLEMLLTVFSFLFVDLFDTVGTLVGVSSRAGMLDADGKLPRVKKALMSDAIGTIAGALLGTSTVTTFVESSSGVAEGGRTGLTSVVTALCFLLGLIFAPLFRVIPTSATAPALVVVGLFMMMNVSELDFSDFTESIPAFLTIIMMPFGYSIANGIVFGMVSYVVLKVLAGRAKEVSPVMYILAVLFVIKILYIG